MPHRHKRPPVVLPLHKRVLYASTALLWVTGAGWLYWNNARQPLWMTIHGAAAMVFLTIFGLMLFEHMPAGWSQEAHRPSGLGVVIVFGILTVTGWGLYYLGDEGLRKATHLIHSWLGLGVPLLLFIHVWQARSRPKPPPRRAPSSEMTMDRS